MNFRPIAAWPKPFTRIRQVSRFSAGLQDTWDLLERELKAINATNIVLQLAISADDLRRDGKPRAGARPAHPGVILSFEMTSSDKRKKCVSMPCDKFTTWQDNIRAIALSLEALRKVDRYGVTQTGEQYQGWEALPPGTSSGFQTREDAALWLATVSGDDSPYLLSDPERRRRAYKTASRKLHPDAGGLDTDFHKIEQAKTLLEN